MAEADGSDAFRLITEYAVALGASSIVELEGCWERQVDEHWWVAINGHAEGDAMCSRGAAVPAHHCYVEHDGWMAGVIGASGGMIAAGQKATEQTFIAAVRRAMTALEGRSRV